MAGLGSTVHNRLRHGEAPLTAFLRRSCGFDTVTQTPTLPLTLQLPSPRLRSPSFHFQSPPPPHHHHHLRPTSRPARISRSLAALKEILNRHHCGPLFLLSLPLSFQCSYSEVGASPPRSPCSPCTVILNFTQFSVPRGGRRENKKRDESESRA